jgi:hypothetical protein
MPAHQCVGLHNRKDRAPVEKSRQLSQCETNGIRSATRLTFSLNIKPELFAQKQILGSECR